MQWIQNVLLWAAAVLTVFGTAGCGGSSSSSTAPPTLTPRSASAVLPNGLTAMLTADRGTVSIGGTVSYTLMLTNTLAQPITYQPVNGGGPSLSVPGSLVVLSPSGETAYPVGAIANHVSIGPAVTLAPGQSVSEVLAVDTNTNTGLTIPAGYAAAGTYTATAVFGYVSGVPAGSEPITSGSVGPVSVQAQ